jgi:transcriptional regulator with XRE-family HTH domain
MQLRLKEYRTARGVTQGQLAQAVGVTTAAVGKWERGDNQLKLSDAAAVADLLGCSLDELAGRTPPDDPGRGGVDAAWAALGPAGREKLADYARLLVQDELAAREGGAAE